MKQEQQTFFTIADVINIAMSNMTNPNKISCQQENDISVNVISDLSYSITWNTFTKWCNDQAEAKHLINIYQFCDMFYYPEKPIEGIILKLTDYFLKQNNLTWDKDDTNYNKYYHEKEYELTTEKLNYIVIAKESASKNSLVQNCLNNLFSAIGQILSSNGSAQIDLGTLGTLSANMGSIKHTPNKLKGDTVTNKKITVQSLMGRCRVRDPADASESSPPFTTDEFGKTQQKQQSNINSVYEEAKNQNNESLQAKKKIINDSLQFKAKKTPYQNIMSKQISIPMPNSNWKLKEMLNATFKRVYIQKVKPNPVLFNDYSNTKAAPFTAEKTQIPISHRIGSFYTLSLQNYIVDVSSKCIKRLYDEYFDKYKNIKCDEPATERDEYLAILEPDKVDQNKIKLKREAYQRYNDFINYSINDHFIAEMKNEWFLSIITMANKSYNVKDYDNLLNQCLSEITKDYKISMKTSILDYILKHPEQREKLNIPVPFRKIKEYSEERITRPSDGNQIWKQNWNKNKLSLSNNLYIMCENVTKIMKYFEKNLKNTSYIELNENDVLWGTAKLNNFMETQKTKVDQQTETVTKNWMKYVENILKENKIYKDQLILYFKSVSGLMSSELRKLIIGSIERYYNFMKQFKKDKYYSAKEIFDKQYTLDIEFQKSFIEVDILEDPNKSKEHFSFSDSLSEIQTKLMKVITDIIDKSTKVERPDNMFIKNVDKKANLWQVPLKDSVVDFMYNEINRIISENIAVIEKVTDLYEPFVFVMNEKEEIKKFIYVDIKKGEKPPSRDDYRKKIAFYEQKLKALNEMPNALHMNMIKINCDDINKKIRDKLEEFINDLLKSILTINIFDKAKFLNEQCDIVKTDLEPPVTSEKGLYDKENKYEIYKSEKVPDLFRQYEDFVEWIFFYLSYDTYNVYQPVKEGVNQFEQSLQQCHSSFSGIEHFLKQEGDNIEQSKKNYIAKLDDERKLLIREITRLKGEIDKRKEDINRLYCEDSDFLKTLEANEESIKSCENKLKIINDKEQNLGIAFITEDERIEQCKFDLEPILNYFRFIVEFSKFTKDFFVQNVFNINLTDLDNIMSKYDLFEITEKKINSVGFRKKIAAKRSDFDIFKQSVEKVLLIYPIFEMFKNREEEDYDVINDNGYYCLELSKYLGPKYQFGDDRDKAQKEFLYLHVIQVIQELSLQIDKKKPEIQKVVEEWQNVYKMHKNRNNYRNILDKFELVNHKQKEYTVISKNCFEKAINGLKNNVNEIGEYLNNFDHINNEVFIIKSYAEWKVISSELLEIIQKMKDVQDRVTDYMDKVATFKQKTEIMEHYREAIKLYKSIIDEINENKLMELKDSRLTEVKNDTELELRDERKIKFKDGRLWEVVDDKLVEIRDDKAIELKEGRLVDGRLMMLLLISADKKKFFSNTLDETSRYLNEVRKKLSS